LKSTIHEISNINRIKPEFIEKFIICKNVVEDTKKLIIKYGSKKKECIVFWSGILDGEVAYIKTVICPRFEATSISAQLNNQALEYIHNILLENKEFIFIQVHSHPGVAFHSTEDNSGALSYKIGFISIVVPYFGDYMEEIKDCAVFEYAGNSNWNELSADNIINRFIIPEQKRYDFISR
jgi:hypothetical protein